MFHKILIKIKQLFCIHEDDPQNRRYGIIGYVYKCPKCRKHRGYSREHDVDIPLSEKSYNEYIKFFVEGK